MRAWGQVRYLGLLSVLALLVLVAQFMIGWWSINRVEDATNRRASARMLVVALGELSLAVAEMELAIERFADAGSEEARRRSVEAFARVGSLLDGLCSDRRGHVANDGPLVAELVDAVHHRVSLLEEITRQPQGARAGQLGQILGRGSSDSGERVRQATQRLRQLAEGELEARRLEASSETRRVRGSIGFLGILGVLLVVCAVVAVTRSARAEAEQARQLQATLVQLQKSELRFRRLVESNLIGIVMARGDLLQESNNTVLGLIGRTDDELPLSLASITAPGGGGQVPRADGAGVESAETAPVEKVYVRKDGRLLPVLEGVVSLEGEETIRFILDLTSRRRLEAELRQAQKLEAVGRLAAGVAHEINTPLHYVGMNLHFLGDAFADVLRWLEAGKAGGVHGAALAKEVADTPEGVDVEYLAEEIPKAIQQGQEGIGEVARIVGAMKEFARPGSQEKVEVDLNHALQCTLEVCRSEWKDVAEVVTCFDENLPAVRCLPAEMNQVFLSIILNAVYAIAHAERSGGQKGVIEVTTLHGQDFVEVHIGDTGGGIPEAIRDKVFEPFFTTRDVGEGTGQGLAVSRSIVVDKHQGTLTFQVSEGAGTTFLIRLPLPSGDP